MRLPSRLSLAAAAAFGAGCLFAMPSNAATFTCSASASINDSGPSGQKTSSAPCGFEFGADPGAVFAASSATAGILRAGTHAEATTAAFISASAYAESVDDVMVSGLGEGGATLTFQIAADGFLRANAGATDALAGAPTASSSFRSQISLSTSAGRGANRIVSGCVRNVDPGISTCNGVFDYGPSQSETVDALLPISIFVNNGDSLHIFYNLQTSSLARTVTNAQGANTTAGFGHTFYWDGLVFDDASRNVVLTSASGFDYRFSALPSVAGVPEPGTWALMIVGFGAVGGVARRRRLGVTA